MHSFDAKLSHLQPPARPPPFKPWPSTTAMLISHVHAHLAAAVVSHSSPLVQALLAWLLQKTSMAWRQSVSAWVGWPGASASAKEPRLVTRGDRGVQKTQPWSGAEVEWALNERGEEDVGYIVSALMQAERLGPIAFMVLTLGVSLFPTLASPGAFASVHITLRCSRSPRSGSCAPSTKEGRIQRTSGRCHEFTRFFIRWPLPCPQFSRHRRRQT